MKTDFLLVTPPFCQTNTPYPATAYLSSYLRRKGLQTAQLDLGIEVLLRIFSAPGLEQLFSEAELRYQQTYKNPLLRDSCFIQKNAYIQFIDGVIQFLQDNKSKPVPNWIEQLPQGKFLHASIYIHDLSERETAIHKCTLFLEDLSRFIQEHVDPHFEFSRYGEQLGRSAYSFDEYHLELEKPLGILEHWMIESLEKSMIEYQPKRVGFSLPFPGNVLSALRCAQHIKKHYSQCTVIMGGGFVNTELREIKDERFFELCDHLLFDDGEDALETYLQSSAPARCIIPEKHIPFGQHALPDYSDLHITDYFSMLPISNPMHRLWNDGRWIKMVLAHGCYWGKCSFCDGNLDYIRRYDPLKPEQIVDTMEFLMEQQKQHFIAAGKPLIEEEYNGFHFVDEAAPPVVLRKISELIIARNLKVRWWTNIRFEKTFDQALCMLMAKAGCIAVSGGLEVASPRILGLIGKGVNVPQAFEVCRHLSEAEIMVHAYLMYGFPSQTKEETYESLENVRLLFSKGYIQSAFWHRFALTTHSPMGKDPAKFHCRLLPQPNFAFAKNDLIFEQTCGDDPDLFGAGLNKALYNYMHGVGFELPLSHWFR